MPTAIASVLRKSSSFAVLLMFCASASCQDAADPSQTLDRIFKSYARDTAPYFPFSASDNGDHRYDGVFANDLGDEYRTGLKRLCSDYLRELGTIDKAALPRQAQLSHTMFERRLVNCIDSFAGNWHWMPINQASGWHANFPVMGAGNGSHPFKTVRNYEDFLKRIDGFVVWIDTAIANMRIGMAQEVIQPRDLMLKVLPQLEAHIVDMPAKSMFYTPLTKFPSDFDEETRRALTARYIAAIETKIVPAYRRLHAFMRDEYIPACRTTSGLVDLPGGSDMYRRAVRIATTTDMTPEQIHALGLAEVDRVHAEIVKLKAEIDAAHDVPLTRHGDADSLLDAYREFRSTVEKELPKLFGRLPKTDFEIRAIEAFREKSMSSSYLFPPINGSRPGVFYLNTASMKAAGAHGTVQRSLFLHEAVPGHHLQVALQRESTELPLFRRTAWYAAFGEGWALYAESLGDDMGLYRNRRDRLAMRRDELYRAARLVVDVGLHEKGWTRQQAIDYMRERGGMAAAAAEREVERYMAWPGQALSYKIGQLKILAIRQKVEAALGGSFDLRAFHDELLRDGAMPLDILDAKMERWLAAQQAR
ncbi:DUF885 domain-containing protein [Noviherbaspirillum cavernae]|nr:DUF885 domain-containing protein [Noviherbaspirillum cavernae]